MTPLEQLRDLVAEGRWSEAHRRAGSDPVGRSYVLGHARCAERTHVRKPAVYGYGDGGGNGYGYGGDPTHCPWLIDPKAP